MYTDSGLRIRKIKTRKDVLQIGELIENCFHPYLDPDGRRFVENLQQIGKEYRDHPFFSLFRSFDLLLKGFVSINPEGKIDGVVTLFPCNVEYSFGYLIANVCVAPESRHKGIATALMAFALRYAEKHHADTVYLQVREETPEAVRLYRKLNFTEDAYRTIWIRPKSDMQYPDEKVITFTEPNEQERTDFIHSFYKAYPEKILWNLNYVSDIFGMGALAKIKRHLRKLESQFYQIQNADHQTIGWAAWQKTNSFTDTLWLVPTEDCTGEEMTAALRKLGDLYADKKAVSINFEKGRFTEAFEKAGFHKQGNSIWMSKKL